MKAFIRLATVRKVDHETEMMSECLMAEAGSLSEAIDIAEAAAEDGGYTITSADIFLQREAEQS